MSWVWSGREESRRRYRLASGAMPLAMMSPDRPAHLERSARGAVEARGARAASSSSRRPAAARVVAISFRRSIASRPRARSAATRWRDARSRPVNGAVLRQYAVMTPDTRPSASIGIPRRAVDTACLQLRAPGAVHRCRRDVVDHHRVSRPEGAARHAAAERVAVIPAHLDAVEVPVVVARVRGERCPAASAAADLAAVRGQRARAGHSRTPTKPCVTLRRTPSPSTPATPRAPARCRRPRRPSRRPPAACRPPQWRPGAPWRCRW
jgi:hypothetical protein